MQMTYYRGSWKHWERIEGATKKVFKESTDMTSVYLQGLKGVHTVTLLALLVSLNGGRKTDFLLAPAGSHGGNSTGAQLSWRYLFLKVFFLVGKGSQKESHHVGCPQEDTAK